MRNHTLLLITVLIGALYTTGCSKNHDVGNVEKPPVIVLKGTSLETVKNAAIPEMLDVVGSVRSRSSAVVSTRIPGSISVLRVREGDRVKKGQLLIQLDAQENQATAAVATASIDEARRALDEALSRKKLADVTFDRFNNLYKEQAVSRQEFDVKQAEKEMAAQGVARAESRLRQSQEGAKGATTLSDYTRIVAPISGVIVAKQVDAGATVFPGQPLLTIEDDGSYQLELSLPENVITKVKIGSPLQVTLDSVDNTLNARVTEIVPTADPGSRTFTARINLNLKGLKSGMFGRAALDLGTAATGITVPKAAVIERGALTSLWCVDKENIAHMRIVKVGRVSGERVEILSGLTEGDRIVVVGAQKVTEAAKVE